MEYYRLNIYFNEGTTKDGKKYKVPHTFDYGVDMTVQLNGGIRTAIDYDEQTGQQFIMYDPRRAGLYVNKKGYVEIHITDEDFR